MVLGNRVAAITLRRRPCCTQRSSAAGNGRDHNRARGHGHTRRRSGNRRRSALGKAVANTAVGRHADPPIGCADVLRDKRRVREATHRGLCAALPHLRNLHQRDGVNEGRRKQGQIAELGVKRNEDGFGTADGVGIAPSHSNITDSRQLLKFRGKLGGGSGRINRDRRGHRLARKRQRDCTSGARMLARQGLHLANGTNRHSGLCDARTARQRHSGSVLAHIGAIVQRVKVTSVFGVAHHQVRTVD